MSEDLERLKQRLPLLEYLRRHNWNARPAGMKQEFVGLCPLHRDTHPSFYVNSRKNLFYCHGCGRGGDLIRFVELFRNLSFRQSVAHLQQEVAADCDSQLLEHAHSFYQLQLHRFPEAAQYLEERGLRDSACVEALGIGYAPGGNLRRHLASLSYSFDRLCRTGLINEQGRDAFCRRVVFPCRHNGRIVNLYGRSIVNAFPHRLLPCSKGGLVAWEAVSRYPAVILTEGLFDVAVLWQAGFRSATCAVGTNLTSLQFHQLCDRRDRLVYIVFDQDENQAGQRAALQLAKRLADASVPARLVQLPGGHDPNSYFVAGATADDFNGCLERAQSI